MLGRPNLGELQFEIGVTPDIKVRWNQFITQAVFDGVSGPGVETLNRFREAKWHMRFPTYQRPNLASATYITFKPN